jgi:hypothetical protein
MTGSRSAIPGIITDVDANGTHRTEVADATAPGVKLHVRARRTSSRSAPDLAEVQEHRTAQLVTPDRVTAPPGCLPATTPPPTGWTTSCHRVLEHEVTHVAHRQLLISCAEQPAPGRSGHAGRLRQRVRRIDREQLRTQPVLGKAAHTVGSASKEALLRVQPGHPRASSSRVRAHAGPQAAGHHNAAEWLMVRRRVTHNARVYAKSDAGGAPRRCSISKRKA